MSVMKWQCVCRKEKSYEKKYREKGIYIMSVDFGWDIPDARKC